ncbi:Beta-peptidyl aminopeptidase BapA [Aliiroseovarius sp. xm-v-225]|uniref:DmpA family aminopeptidase n=1 Tax=unclassified Aliiroseovarius TaxID=2623558 RepID=UPI00156987BA|nr:MULTISPECIES: P1 family peptidase [unclassified Aliiroseovarius]NRP45715.1 Beta-peptidyl aminopeptidase BapA [Aliiroseovarius sp. xm-m-378]NRP66583.1 Beta-peptidyl aminopeptidase BapA [Aliiroseovarius sp. xm-v-225]NRP93609.1 Beta-peptidyl aminopeptidase BapA [Aliiroseovarius sp. xm-a-134]
MASTHMTRSGKPRARALGLNFEGKPGPSNNITDVDGVSVGYSTIVEGDGALRVGDGPVRTGVTAILPRRPKNLSIPVFAGYHNFNGNGEMSGAHYLDEVGQLTFPVTITNTHSCGVTRDATLKWASRAHPGSLTDAFGLPVSAETYDGFLNDINGFHVTEDHVFEAIETASSGAIEEGSVGGGTGMKCFGFKAGSGSASRVVRYGDESYMVGVFVQANFGTREHLTICGINIGAGLPEPAIVTHTPPTDLSSIIVVIATDAPLMPHQLKRLSRRATLGMGRLGTIGNHSSGDLFLAFSTANEAALAAKEASAQRAAFIPDPHLDQLFEAVVQGVEEAIINSMVAAETMVGRDGNTVPAIPHNVLRQLADTAEPARAEE